MEEVAQVDLVQKHLIQDSLMRQEWEGVHPKRKKQMSQTITDFMKNAKDGDVYRVGGGIGSGGETFSITGSGSKMKIRTENGRSVLMNRANVKSWIANGATLVKRGK